jgi:hypothetical protein
LGSSTFFHIFDFSKQIGFILQQLIVSRCLVLGFNASFGFGLHALEGISDSARSMVQSLASIVSLCSDSLQIFTEVSELFVLISTHCSWAGIKALRASW